MGAINYLKGLGAVTVLYANFGCASTNPPLEQSSPIEPTITRAPQSLTAELGKYSVRFECAAGDRVLAEVFQDNQPIQSKSYSLSNFEDKLKRDSRTLRYMGYWDKAENRRLLDVASKAATLCNG